MANKSPSERRKYIRFRYPFYIRCEKYEKKDEQFENAPITFREIKKDKAGVSTDISLGGLCFINKKDFPPDTLLSLELFTPTQTQPFQIIGKVAWRKKGIATRNYQIGVEFLKIDKESEFKTLLEMLEEVKLEEVTGTEQPA